MTDDPMDRSLTITLPIPQVFALLDLIGESLASAQPSSATPHNASALHSARENLDTAIRSQLNDG